MTPTEMIAMMPCGVSDTIGVRKHNINIRCIRRSTAAAVVVIKNLTFMHSRVPQTYFPRCKLIIENIGSRRF